MVCLRTMRYSLYIYAVLCFTTWSGFRSAHNPFLLPQNPVHSLRWVDWLPTLAVCEPDAMDMGWLGSCASRGINLVVGRSHPWPGCLHPLSPWWEMIWAAWVLWRVWAAPPLLPANWLRRSPWVVGTASPHQSAVWQEEAVGLSKAFGEKAAAAAAPKANLYRGSSHLEGPNIFVMS